MSRKEHDEAFRRAFGTFAAPPLASVVHFSGKMSRWDVPSSGPSVGTIDLRCVESVSASGAMSLEGEPLLQVVMKSGQCWTVYAKYDAFVAAMERAKRLP